MIHCVLATYTQQIDNSEVLSWPPRMPVTRPTPDSASSTTRILLVSFPWDRGGFRYAAAWLDQAVSYSIGDFESQALCLRRLL